MPWKRRSCGSCGTGSGGDSGGNRWENVMNGFMQKGFEVVIYFTIKKMCKGGHVGLKMGGPQHTPPCGWQQKGTCGSAKGCCCWWDSGIHNDDGKAYLEIESSHESEPSNCRTKEFSGAKIATGKPVGMRWHISREGSGIRLMLWVDTSGTVNGNKWRQVFNVLDTGQYMPRDYYSHIPNEQNIELRISDAACGDIIMHSASSRKILPGGLTSEYYYEDRFSDLTAPMRVTV